MVTLEEQKVVLRTSKDWEKWILMVEMFANTHGLWKYIDPDSDESLQKPQVEDLANVPKGVEYELALVRFKADLEEYKWKLDGTREINYKVRSTVDVRNLYIIRGISDAREVIRALAKHFRPKEFDLRDEICSRWETLCSGPPKGIPVDEWIPQWIELYTRAKHMEIGDFLNEDLRIRDFLFAIKPLNESFAQYRLLQLVKEQQLNFYEIVRDFICDMHYAR
ncbi:hypothetical protein PHISCL_08018 [Aspergillus sclerotialis]|uniref:Uncharacterized protein n=1 Tax=Aspergillus sclerotialis TaxID=2070753 RepID=A0A3A2ZBL3_9EURO|nr:hypothetical protein PHISCL_08018 [Aspergillus sclerotialis]